MPKKLFPLIETDTKQPPTGVSTRNSKILHHFAPLKLLGKREYIDPNFLEELDLQRTDRIVARRVASLHSKGTSSIIIDEHSLQPLPLYAKAHPEDIPYLPTHTPYILQYETTPSQTLSFSAPTYLYGSGTISFANEISHELSFEEPLQLQEPTTLRISGGTLLTIVTTQDPEYTPTLPLSVYNSTEAHIPNVEMHTLDTPYQLPNTYPTVHFQLTGITEVYQENHLVDIIYTGEERLFETTKNPYTLSHISEKSCCIHILWKQ